MYVLIPSCIAKVVLRAFHGVLENFVKLFELIKSFFLRITVVCCSSVEHVRSQGTQGIEVSGKPSHFVLALVSPEWWFSSLFSQSAHLDNSRQDLHAVAQLR